MAAEAGEDEDSFVAGMAAENGAERPGDEDGAAPAVRDADIFESGMHVADARFEPMQAVGGDTLPDVEAQKIAEGAVGPALGKIRGENGARRFGRREEACAEDDPVVLEEASPEIGKVDGVEGAAGGQARRAKLQLREGSSGER